jgi:hypothetical protein
MWENVGQATDDNLMRAHCMLHNEGYKYIHSGSAIRFAFPQELCLQEHTSVLCNMYVACLVKH